MLVCQLFLNHIKHWVATAKVFNQVNEEGSTKKFKYEDLNNSYKNIEQLLKFYELSTNRDIIESCLNAPVVGSSFGLVSKKSKPKWSRDTEKSKYTFTHKWKHWGIIKKLVFKTIAGKTLVALGYENALDW